MELLEKILNGSNIADAIEKVMSNKSVGGIDEISVNQFQEMVNKGEINFEEIKEQIRNRKYKPNPVKRVYIPKKNGGTRILGIPTVEDRMAQMVKYIRYLTNKYYIARSCML